MAEQMAGFIKALDDDLVMRRSAPEDADRLAEFNARIFGEDPYDARTIAAWTRDLLLKPHPTFQPDDFVIVENRATGEIVSSLNLISQTWSYEGISFGVGRPELVGTDPNYRNRGLVRTMFEVMHAWSKERGELAQMITGIPFFYRQFGYEMGLELGGGRSGYEPQVPRLSEGQEELYQFRPVTEADLPFIMRMHQCECSRSMVSAVRGQEEWRNELFVKSPENASRMEFRIITSREGQPSGYLSHGASLWGTSMALTGYQLEDGVSYFAVTPSVIRYLWSTGKEYATLRGRSLESFEFSFGTTAHPGYQAAAERLVREKKPYAFYVRVHDLPAFLNRIKPVLERRLQESPCAGYTGELKVSFYRGGLKLVFDNGILLQAETWKPGKDSEVSAAFPNLAFLQLVFGYRSLGEIQYANADCWATEQAHVLLPILFPRKPSDIWPVS